MTMPPNAAVPVRVPPIPTAVEELHAAYGCRVGRLADGIVMFVFADLGAQTMVAWEHWLFPHLTEVHLRGQLERHLYDMRRVQQPTAAGFQTAVRVNQHAGVKLIRTAVLAKASLMLDGIRAVLQAIPHTNAQLFSDEFAAVQWLNQSGAK